MGNANGGEQCQLNDPEATSGYGDIQPMSASAECFSLPCVCIFLFWGAAVKRTRCAQHDFFIFSVDNQTIVGTLIGMSQTMRPENDQM
jgi:hypothetical protein